MNFFEKELRSLFSDGSIIRNPVFIGRTCYGDITEDLRARIEFISSNAFDQYNALRVTILSRSCGALDRIEIDFEDMLGRKQSPRSRDPQCKVKPYVWVYQGKASWYGFRPDEADRTQIRNYVCSYLDVFRPREDRGRAPTLNAMIRDCQAKAARRNTKQKHKSSPKLYRDSI